MSKWQVPRLIADIGAVSALVERLLKAYKYAVPQLPEALKMPQTGSYTLLDAGDFQKLEQIGPYRIVRPSPQAVWRKHLSTKEWANADAAFTRFSGGDGSWDIKNKKLKEAWHIEQAGIRFVIRLTDFGHLGIFPEQEKNWLRLQQIVKERLSRKQQDFQVLNLFAYTGGSSLACAKAGAKVVHIDASKTSVAWARENAEASGLTDAPVRWIVEDVKKFVAREQKRGSRYHGVVLDPPSYGRGNKGETWKIETDLPELMLQIKSILASDFAFVLLSAHSTGYTPIALENVLRQSIGQKGDQYFSEEMLIPGTAQNFALPSGTSCLHVRA